MTEIYECSDCLDDFCKECEPPKSCPECDAELCMTCVDLHIANHRKEQENDDDKDNNDAGDYIGFTDSGS